MKDKLAGCFGSRRVLVTGGLGFIGVNLCARLVQLGAEVTVLDNFVPLSPGEWLESLLRSVRLVVADIRDAEKVERAVRDQDVIFNLAGKSGAADSNKTPLNDLDINCRGQLTILEACRSFNPEVAIIFSSSRLVYGKPCSLPVDESHPLAPESIYAVHKLAVENYHMIYGRLHGLKATVLRISNPYGPFQTGEGRAYGIANRFIQLAVADRQITLFGDGHQRRDYIYIDDLVEAMLAAAATEKGVGRTYNIGDGAGCSLAELARMAVEEAGSGTIVTVPWPSDYQAIETGDYLSNISLASRELGWSPKISVREGIARTVAYYRSNPHM